MDEVSDPTTSQKPKAMEEQPKKGIAVKTLLLIVFLAAVASGLLYVAVLQEPKQQVTQLTPTTTPDPIQTVLTISSVPTPLSTPSAYTTDVVINTGQTSVTGVQLELSYNPKVLTKVNIVPGPFFVDPVVNIKNIDPVNGRISLAVSVPTQQGVKNGILGQGIVATINFSVLPGQKSTPTAITFLPKTEVSSEGTSSSVLKSTVDANFTISPKATSSSF